MAGLYNKKIENETKSLVISASRRTDLVAWFPDFLARKIVSVGTGRIHTLVIWTKNPLNLFNHKILRNALEIPDQVFIHLTVTGMGGTIMEPGIPSTEEVLGQLGRLAEIVRSPKRIRWRFDPLVTWEESNSRFSNLEYFPVIAPYFTDIGVTNAITSICTLYPKVVRQFKKRSLYRPVSPPATERETIIDNIEKMAERRRINLDWCCEPSRPSRGCIDGNLLTELHPYGREAPTDITDGQRELCTCTRSWDIGWYNQRCRGGCLYCYASSQG